VKRSPAILLGLLAAAPPLYAWALRMVLRHNVSRFMAGDVHAFLRLYAYDATLIFPGRHSWSGEYRGKEEIERFLRRFLAARLRGEIQEVVVKGPPWNTTMCVQFTDEATAPDGTVVYENRALILVKAAWGKILREEVFEDTQKVAELDEYLEANEPELAVSEG
jgi:ketosteroid isomerase-like protein